MNYLIFLLLSAAGAASAQAPAANLARIGAAAAVKGLVQAQAPGAVGRVVQSGKPLYLNDHVTTDAAGRLQVLLLDETVFTMGPNSDMVLDEFVYDPVDNAGKVAARVTKGMFRFVTGKVARKDPASMKVKLPVGTIGIRGTIAAGQASEQGSTVILLGPGSQNNANENPGSVSVANAGGEVVITQPGFGTTVAPGQPPAAVTEMSQQAQQIMNALGEPPPSQAKGGASGGGSAGQDSGQDTAAGSALAGDALGIGTLAKTLDNDQTLAIQDAIAKLADGLSTWDDVRSVPSGVTYYSGSGSYTCSGTLLCSGGGSGTVSVYIPIDFGSRSIGDPATSNISIAGTLTDFTRLKTVDFSSLSGDAAITMAYSGGTGNSTSQWFDNTTITLLNRDGIAAKDISVNLQYNDTSDQASGTATGTR